MRNILPIISCFFILLAASCSAQANGHPPAEESAVCYQILVDQTSDLPPQSQPLTLYEAWDLAVPFAAQWSKDAEMLDFTSTDAHDRDQQQTSGNAAIEGLTFSALQQNETWSALALGQNGARRSWQAIFASRRNNCQLQVEITDGKIVYAASDGYFQPGLPLTQKPFTDSPAALQKALEKYPGFLTGKAPYQGYHFVYRPNSDLHIIGSVTGEIGLITSAVLFENHGEKTSIKIPYQLLHP